MRHGTCVLSQRISVIGAIILLCTNLLLADVRLPHFIGSHMVLQRDVPVSLWGWADPGEAVNVRLGETQVAAKAGDDGQWLVKLPATPAGGPHKITVTGQNKIELEDVLFGEVWVCSGQSNMDMGIKSVKNTKEEIASAKYPQIRLCWVPYRTAGTPSDDVDATWSVCSPETIAEKGFFNTGFSAVAYFFGRDLYKELNVPVGLIHTAWGGTRIEPWTPREGFELDPQFQKTVQQIDEATPKWNRAALKTVQEIESWIPGARAALESGKKVKPPPELPKHELDSNAQPTGLYNAMIHPFLPYVIRGAIWYQGESNLKDGLLYRDRMKALINGWRKVWGLGDFPFYFVQIAPFHYGDEAELLPILWDAQIQAMSIPNTGMAPTVDIGDLKDIHPKNKQDVGHRLALWALAKTYGHGDVSYEGPKFRSMKVEDGAIRIRFDPAGGELATRDGKAPNWFQISGEDKKFVEGHATIDGDSVIVRADSVAAPVAVRFAWSQEASPNLMNKQGLPATPFRTDKW